MREVMEKYFGPVRGGGRGEGAGGWLSLIFIDFHSFFIVFHYFFIDFSLIFNGFLYIFVIFIDFHRLSFISIFIDFYDFH